MYKSKYLTVIMQE